MTTLVYSLVGIVALALSFAVIGNSLIDRIPTNQPITYPKPYCRSCAALFSFKDIIPVWSYVHHRGKCPYCQDPLPVRNLIIEVTILVWVAGYILIRGWSYAGFLEMTFGTLLIAIIIIESEKFQNFNSLLLLLIALGTIYNLAFQPESFPQHILSLLVGMGIFLAYNLIKIKFLDRKRLNATEIKLGAVLGLFLGLPKTVVCLNLGLTLGLVLGLINVLSGRKTVGNAVPEFPILLSLAAMATILAGDLIITKFNLWILR